MGMAQGIILWELYCIHHYKIQQLPMETAYLFIDMKPFFQRRALRTATPVEVTCTHSGYTQVQLKAVSCGCLLELSKYPAHGVVAVTVGTAGPTVISVKILQCRPQ